MESRLQPARSEETCQRCGEELAPRIAYCASCGQRTRYAKRMVRFWARLEILLVLLMFVLVAGFALTFYFQR